MNLTRDDRDELAAAALVGERRNRPRGLVILSGIVAAIAVVVLLWSTVSVLRARSTQADQLGFLKQTQSLVATLHGLRSSGQNNGRPDLEPLPNLLTTIEDLAVAAGLKKPNLPTRTFEGRGAIREVRRKYNQFRENDIAKVLTWIDSVVSDIPGVFVHQLKIDPEGNIWKIDVTFSRWERQP